MARVGRRLLAVVAGFALWGILWNLGTTAAQAVFPTFLIPDQPVVHAGALWGLITYSVLLSILVGYVARLISDTWAVLSLSIVNLVAGIIAEVSYWELMPVWYHVVFLILVVPATLVGGMLKGEARTPSARTANRTS